MLQFFCSLDGTELVDLYSPDIDDDNILSSPENFAQLNPFEQEAIRLRREALLEVLANVNDQKKKRLNRIMTEQSALILVCPYCKKVYDSTSILLQEKTHSDSNMVPYRKPKEHKVISDDMESIQEATNIEINPAFDYGFFGGPKQIFFPNEDATTNNSNKKDTKQKSSGTLFKDSQNMSSIKNIKHAAKELKQIAEKFGADNVNIQLEIPDN